MTQDAIRAGWIQGISFGGFCVRSHEIFRFVLCLLMWQKSILFQQQKNPPTDAYHVPQGTSTENSRILQFFFPGEEMEAPKDLNELRSRAVAR